MTTANKPDDALRAAICKIFNIFPDELEYDLPGGIGITRMEQLEALFTRNTETVLESLRAEYREYEVTDLEMLEHRGKTPLEAVPVAVIEKYLAEIRGRLS